MNTFRVQTATVALLAALAVNIGIAAPAHARPKHQPGASEYWSCVVSSEDSATGGHRSTISWEARDAIYESCCTDLGGIYNENTYDCYLPNGETAKPNAPPSGAVHVPRGLSTDVREK